MNGGKAGTAGRRAKRDEAAAREEAKRQEKEERRRQKELAKLAKGKGVGLGRLRSREENDYDDDPVAPIDDIVQRLQPYAQPRGPVTPVPDAPQDEQQISDDVQDPSDRTA